jgi:hypothetical protein
MTSELTRELRLFDSRGFMPDDGFLIKVADRIDYLELELSSITESLDGYVERIKQLEAALRPFARFMEIIDQHDELPVTSGVHGPFRVGELRQAKRVLESKP